MSGKHPSLSGIPLVLGGNVFGWTIDRDRSFEVLDAFYENGGRMIDTAEGYSVWVPGHKGGESETVIGEWLESRGVRKHMRIATKTNMAGEPGGLAPARLLERCQASLERLRTDYIDLYYAHRDEEQTPQAEVAEGFKALFDRKLIREAGASNFSLDRLASAQKAAEAAGAPAYGVLQNQYNLLERDAYPPQLQAFCVQNDVAMLPFFGLASGFLTGKYRKDADFARYPRGEGLRKYAEPGKRLLPVMDRIATETEATLGQVALAWLLSQPGIAAPIASATTADQVDDLVEAMELELSAAQVAALTKALD
jgi:aryl-alcohol dehydrogenase-like predicted oxidoreductase